MPVVALLTQGPCNTGYMVIAHLLLIVIVMMFISLSRVVSLESDISNVMIGISVIHADTPVAAPDPVVPAPSGAGVGGVG